MKSKRRNCRIVRDVSWTKPLQERKTVNTMGKCILIGAGDLTMGELSVTEEDYVIAVDGGLSYCGILNVEPDLIIGDFDSMSEQEKLAVEQLQQTVPEKICRLQRDYELCRRILRIIDGEAFSLEEMDKCRIEIMHRYPQYEVR